MSLRTLNLYVTEDVIRMREAEGLDAKPENLSSVSDKAAALFNICLAFGNIIAPILGGALVDGLGGVENKDSGGFAKAADVMSSVLIVNFIVYTVMNFLVLDPPIKQGGSVLPDAS